MREDSESGRGMEEGVGVQCTITIHVLTFALRSYWVEDEGVGPTFVGRGKFGVSEGRPRGWLLPWSCNVVSGRFECLPETYRGPLNPCHRRASEKIVARSSPAQQCPLSIRAAPVKRPCRRLRRDRSGCTHTSTHPSTQLLVCPPSSTVTSWLLPQLNQTGSGSGDRRQHGWYT